MPSTLSQRSPKTVNVLVDSFRYARKIFKCIQNKYFLFFILVLCSNKYFFCAVIVDNPSYIPFSLKKITEDNLSTFKELVFQIYKENAKFISEYSENIKAISDLSSIDLLRIFESLKYNGVLENIKIFKPETKNIGVLPLSLFKHLKSLKVLNLEGNVHLNLKNSGFRCIAKQLNELYVQGCNLDKGDLLEILKCKNLIRLNISGNVLFSDALVYNWPVNLSLLIANNVNLTNQSLRSLIKLKKIVFLDLSGSNLRSFFDSIENLGFLRSSLMILQLSKCHLEFKDMAKIRECEKLTALFLSFNN